MRQSAKDYIDEVEKRDLSLEYRCVNALQRTPWRVNDFVVETLRACWNSGQEWE